MTYNACYDCGKPCVGKRCRDCNIKARKKARLTAVNFCGDCGEPCTGQRCRKCHLKHARRQRKNEIRFKAKNKVLSVYVAHPYRGKIENTHKVGIICREIAKIPYLLPISPIHALSFYDERIWPEERESALKLCRELVKKCDLLLLCRGWEESEGCRMELKVAKESGVPIIELKDFKTIFTPTEGGDYNITTSSISK
jgi:hypothetical protein